MQNKEDKFIKNIEEFFKVPEQVADKIKNIAEKVRGGYVLIETRPRWDDPSALWTKSEIAKIIFHKPTEIWRIYWKRASGRWELYGKYKSFNKVLTIIKKDPHGCFWG